LINRYQRKDNLRQESIAFVKFLIQGMVKEESSKILVNLPFRVILRRVLVRRIFLFWFLTWKEKQEILCRLQN